MSTEAKIKALSLKTVANGASEAEAEAALRMIERLRCPQNRENRQKDVSGYNNLPVVEVDWDEVSKQYLNHFQHAEYVEATHSAWERYNKTRLRLGPKNPMTRDEYRIACHKVFERLFDRKQIS